MPGRSIVARWKAPAAALIGAGLCAGMETAEAQDIAERFADGVCYARTYSADHLAEHPGQKVARIWFTADPDMRPDGYAAVLKFAFTLRDGRFYQSFAYCRADGFCGTEGDGGRIQLTGRGQNLRMSIVDYLIVEGDDFSPDLMQSDDRVFLLYPGPASACG
ncbi:hypothetical protein [Roseibium sp. MMSF_3412]|uniref:hypothetical protein n=1 Tax=Roseibium sp. MMSF_3412 TaxID=3046712 RepID=UPI00273EEE35|nr:hypothetical protein [Roseibium sp. MMSF_3412]